MHLSSLTVFLLCCLLPVQAWNKTSFSGGVIHYYVKFKVEGRPITASMWGHRLWVWRLCEYSAANVWVCVCGCVREFSCVFLSIRGRRHAVAAACLFSLAIFSSWPCQGPHNHITHPQWAAVAFSVMVCRRPGSLIYVVSSFIPQTHLFTSDTANGT